MSQVPLDHVMVVLMHVHMPTEFDGVVHRSRGARHAHLCDRDVFVRRTRRRPVDPPIHEVRYVRPDECWRGRAQDPGAKKSRITWVLSANARLAGGQPTLGHERFIQGWIAQIGDPIGDAGVPDLSDHLQDLFL